MLAKFSVGDSVRVARDAAIRTRLARGYGSVPEGTIVHLRTWDLPEVAPHPSKAAAVILAGKGREVQTASDDSTLAVVQVAPPDGLPIRAIFRLAELDK